MEYFYIFKNIDFNLIFKTVLQFTFFYILLIYCKLLYYPQLIQFNEFEKGKIKNKFIFFILSFLYTSLSLLVIPFLVLLANSFENPNFTATKYAFVSFVIILLYCLKKTFLYAYLNGEIIPSTISEMVNKNKQKLNKKPNG